MLNLDEEQTVVQTPLMDTDIEETIALIENRDGLNL